MSDGNGDGVVGRALRQFAADHPEALVAVDASGVIRYANPAAGDLLGPASGESTAVEGRPVTACLALRRRADDDGTNDDFLARLGEAATGTAGEPVPLTGSPVGGGAVALRGAVRGEDGGPFTVTLRAGAGAAGETPAEGPAAERAREASTSGPAGVDTTTEAGEATGVRHPATGGGETPAWVGWFRAFETAADGIAILDDEERYRYCNRAHADLYGVEDPADLVGDHWGELYDDDERERLREEAMAALRTAGEWRGEAVGRRVDGEAFPQELTLSALPDGGLVCVVRDRSAQHRHERALETLRAATSDLLEATDREEVGEVAVRAAARALDLPLSAVFLHDPARDILEPVAASETARETFEELPTFTGEGDSLAWLAFETGRTQRYEDPERADRLYNEETPATAELIVPLDDHGVLLTGHVEDEGFDEEEERLFHTLAATVTTALDRVDSAERLRERNDQLERFSHALSHDLRNPLNTARATLALARRSADDETLEYLDELERVHDRMGSLVEDVLALAAAPTDPDTSPTELAKAARESWETAGGRDAPARLDLDPLGTVEADPGQLRRLLENLFANALEHAGADVTVSVGPLAAEGDDGFYVADDGPGIPSGERDQVFERGYTTDEGTGLGLDIVHRATAAHGWGVSVTGSDAGGARFEIRGPDPRPAGDARVPDADGT